MICLEGLDYSDDSYGSDDDPAEGLDAICGPGTSALDLSATDYLEIITDTLALIEEDEVAYGTTIQEDEVDTVCQVRFSIGVPGCTYLVACAYPCIFVMTVVWC